MIPLRDTLPSGVRPFVTGWLIAVNVMVFFYQLFLPEMELNHFIGEYGFVPARLEVADLFTSMFLHGGWMHLIGNMWFLWVFGDNIEDILGHGKFLLFYVLCGLGAAALQIAVMPDARVPNIGASGAISGVMGAYLLKFPQARITTLMTLIIFFFTVDLPAWVVLAYWFVVQFFSGFGSIGSSHVNEGGVAWFAHIGGFVVGMALIFLMKPRIAYSHRRDLAW
jgi:membrane associated rhomboid family serine protease